MEYYLIHDDTVKYDVSPEEMCKILNIGKKDFDKIIENAEPDTVIQYGRYEIIYTLR